MKKILALCGFLLLAALSTRGQNSTVVTVNATDTSGQPWFSGTYNISFVGPPVVTWPGGTVIRNFSGTLNTIGSVALSLASNATITPTPTFYNITVCPFPVLTASTNFCQTQQFSISGQTKTINFTPPPPQILGSSTPPVAAYSDAEIVSPILVGFIYYQVQSATTGQPRICQVIDSTSACTLWANIGTTGPTGFPRLDQVLNQNQAKTFLQGGSPLGFSGGDFNLSADLSTELPVAVNCTTSANGQICYDSRYANWHLFASGADNFIGTFPVATPPTNGDVAGFRQNYTMLVNSALSAAYPLFSTNFQTGQDVAMFNVGMGGNQFTRVTIAAYGDLSFPGYVPPAGYNETGVMARITFNSDGTFNGYSCLARLDGGFQANRYDNVGIGSLAPFGPGVVTTFGVEFGSPGPAVGQTLEIDATSNQISCKVNGSTILGPFTDSTYATGQPGLEGLATNASEAGLLELTQVSNFVTGPLPSGATTSYTFSGNALVSPWTSPLNFQWSLFDEGPVNTPSGVSFLKQFNTSLIDGDVHCYDSTASDTTQSWPNCTPGVVGRAITGAATTDLVAQADNVTTIDHDAAGSASVTETLPTAATLGIPSFAYKYSNHSTHADSIVPTTWTINGVSSLAVAANTFCTIWVDPNSATNWLADCANSGATTQTISNGTATLGTSAIASGTCATVVTVSGTGIATTDNIMADFNADPTGVVGYQPSATGMLTIIKYPTSGNVNFKVCNSTLNSITPGAITLNWRVTR